VIKQNGLVVLKTAQSALKEEAYTLQNLEKMLYSNDSYAKRMKKSYLEVGDIIKSISDKYKY